MAPRARQLRGSRALLLVSALLWALLLCSSPTVAEPGWERRIVAIGDIHGAYDALAAILQRAELMDEAGRWIGGDTILVQTGDYLDRGIDTIRVIELLMDLERQAPQQGGEVLALLGNHEIFNLIGELKDVTPEILAGFVDGESEQRRLQLCSTWAAIEERRAERRARSDNERGDGDRLPSQAYAQCLQRHPAGMVEYLHAMGPEGRYGRWLRKRPAVVRLGDGLFLHGGLSTGFRRWSPDEINRRVAREIAVLDAARAWLRDQGMLPPASKFQELLDALPRKVRRPPGKLSPEDLRQPLRPVFPRDLEMFVDVRQWLIIRDDGPLWFRGYSFWNDSKGMARLPGILNAQGARYMVVGHTPQRSRAIRERFDGRVFLIDTGMLSSVYAGGQAAALEVFGGEISALYVGRERELLTSLEGRRAEAAAGDSERRLLRSE